MMNKNGFPTNVASAVPALAQATMTAGDETSALIRSRLGDRLIVLVGMMASGKTSVGKLLAARLAIPFVDADHEIETAACMTIPEIFASQGEPYFRSGERRVISRLLKYGPRVLATGGGAFMNAETREGIAQRGLSVWLHAEAETLLRRARKRSNRPLLQNSDPEGTIRKLIEVRYPVYGLADITIHSEDGPHEATVDAIMAALAAHSVPLGAAAAVSETVTPP
jgi:shikimate kinase